MRTPFDLSLYLISDAELCAARGVVDTVLEAVQGGATLIQLRQPHAATDALTELACELGARLRPFGVPLIINDRADVALAAGAAGVHLGQADLPVREARAQLGPDPIIGLSITSLEDLERSDCSAVDYLGVGPIFPTQSKPNAAPPLGLAGLRAIAERTTLPIVAIGGIDTSRAAQIIQHGASGVAVISAICGHPDPRAAASDLARVVREALARQHKR